MRKARFTDEEMVAILREADREPAGIVAKRHKVGDQTIYNWRKKFGALSTDDVRRLKQLEAENTRLKKLVVDRDLGIDALRGAALTATSLPAAAPARDLPLIDTNFQPPPER